jgi:hypothetical protein
MGGDLASSTTTGQLRPSLARALSAENIRLTQSRASFPIVDAASPLDRDSGKVALSSFLSKAIDEQSAVSKDARSLVGCLHRVGGEPIASNKAPAKGW